MVVGVWGCGWDGGGQGLGMRIHIKEEGEEDERWRVDSQVFLLCLGLASFLTSHRLPQLKGPVASLGSLRLCSFAVVSQGTETAQHGCWL